MNTTLLPAADKAAMDRLLITQADRLRFQRKLVPYQGCLLYTGHKDAQGYGRFSFRGEKEQAHRFAYFATHSLWLLPGGDVYHIPACPHRACCNALHLYLGTRKENMYLCNKD